MFQQPVANVLNSTHNPSTLLPFFDNDLEGHETLQLGELSTLKTFTITMLLTLLFAHCTFVCWKIPSPQKAFMAQPPAPHQREVVVLSS
jgi:hypothetical protein